MESIEATFLAFLIRLFPAIGRISQWLQMTLIKIWVELQLLTNRVPKHAIVIIGGDWNASNVMLLRWSRQFANMASETGPSMWSTLFAIPKNIFLLLFASGEIPWTPRITNTLTRLLYFNQSPLEEFRAR